ncbi:VWFA-related Acidobacterial domain protein [Luteitalea pratensis]|uniref:VWFA-related Acidobacterial domain protein n=1 Tax=Luteitalea pratensis TaxID=1855912 RepID=A0A143PWN0_LUTPR|nr:VWA domain-containing protein [Luteitalea pratensis]AMY12666.1 VWFA-related Acidobacterial domain protein [Luteitalea pratensis]
MTLAVLRQLLVGGAAALVLSARVGTQAPATQTPPPSPPTSTPAKAPGPPPAGQEQPPATESGAQPPAAGQQPPRPGAPEQPTFRAGVEVVSLNVTVTERDGRFVSGLPQEAFSVFEDGVKQDVMFFSGTQLPTALGLLVDTSASMNEKLPIAQQAAVGFIQRMRPEDLVTIVDFDSRAEILQGFTADQNRLTSAIRRTTAGGSTSLYNAVYVALNEFKKIRAASAQNEVRRQAIVVLSDGEDTSSLVPFEEVLELAKRTEVAIYAIGLKDGGGPRNRPMGGFSESDFVLKQFAQETGGKAFFPTSADELTNIYGAVADELAAQYTVGYASRNVRRDGRWRRIVVRVERPNTIARTKQGYYGPT